MISLRYQQWTFLLSKAEKEQIQSNFKGSIVICSCKPPTTVTGLVFFNAMRSTSTKKLRPGLWRNSKRVNERSWQKISLTNQPTLDFRLNIQVMVTKGPSNVWCNKNRTKLISVLLLRLVRFLMHQTLFLYQTILFNHQIVRDTSTFYV